MTWDEAMTVRAHLQNARSALRDAAIAAGESDELNDGIIRADAALGAALREVEALLRPPQPEACVDGRLVSGLLL